MEKHPIFVMIITIIMAVTALWSIYNCGKGVAYTEITRKITEYRLEMEVKNVNNK